MTNRFSEKNVCTIFATLLTICILLPITSGNIDTNTLGSTTIVSIHDAEKAATAKLTELDASYTHSICHMNSVENHGTLLCYIAELTPIGFIVIAPDTRLSPVIAYSLTDTVLFTESEYNMPLLFIMEDMESRITNIHRLDEQYISDNTKAWADIMHEYPIKVSSALFQQWPPAGTTITGGWLETNWHQESPYNDMCPLDKTTGERSIAGCPAVTMAQILNYHATNCNVAFTDNDDYNHTYLNHYRIDDDHVTYGFPSFPELNAYLTTLSEHYAHDIPPTDVDKAAFVFACGVAAQQVYSSDVSGTYGVDQAERAYQRFGVAQFQLLTDDNVYTRLATNMVEGLPAHLAVVLSDWSGGHNLVVDGYNTNNYYHLNFGWGGSWNCWYQLPEGIPFDLTVLEGAIVDILTKNATSHLDATGVLVWNDVTPNATVSGVFSIQNTGSDESSINWSVVNWPSWGTWVFSPSNGTGLSPNDESITIEVTVTAPAQKRQDYGGVITVINPDNPSDRCEVHVALATRLTAFHSGITMLDLIRDIINRVFHFPFLGR